MLGNSGSVLAQDWERPATPQDAPLLEQAPAQTSPRSILPDPGQTAPVTPFWENQWLMPPADAAQSDVPAENQEAPQPPAVGDIEVEALEVAGPGSIGIIDGDSGGFPSDVWAGSRAATITSLLSLVPPLTGDAVYQGLLRRLLLTSARPPLAQDEDKRQSEIDFLAARLDRLAAMGDLEALVALLARVGRDAESGRLAHHALTTHLLAGNYPAACMAAPSAPPADDDGAWLQTAAFCRALNGDVPGATLALELLREQDRLDPAFRTLMAAQLRGDSAAAEDLVTPVTPTPLILALLDLQHLPLPAVAVPEVEPLVAARLAALPALAPDLRLEAARRVALAGGYDADRLAQIYGAVQFPAEDVDNALLLAEDLDPAQAEALLYQAVLAASDPVRRAALLSAGFKRAREEGSAALFALVMAPAVAALKPSPELASFAPDAVRMLLLAGRPGAGQAWYRALQDLVGAGNAEAAGYLVDLWPLIMVGAPMDELVYSEQTVDLWWRGRILVDDPNRDAQALTLFTLLEADGHVIPEVLWSSLMNSPAATQGGAPNLTVWRGLMQAANDGRMGETLLMAIVATGTGGPGAAPPVVISSVVRALQAVGLDAEARAIAVAALVGRGL